MAEDTPLIPADDNPPEVVIGYDTEIGELASSLIHDHRMIQHEFSMTSENAFAWMQVATGVIQSLGWVYVNENED